MTVLIPQPVQLLVCCKMSSFYDPKPCQFNGSVYIKNKGFGSGSKCWNFAKGNIMLQSYMQSKMLTYECEILNFIKE